MNKDELVANHMEFMRGIARQYVNRGLSLDELVQAGKVGLAGAAEAFEPERGYKFTTYATWWIRDAITKALANQGESDDRL